MVNETEICAKLSDQQEMAMAILPGESSDGDT